MDNFSIIADFYNEQKTLEKQLVVISIIRVNS